MSINEKNSKEANGNIDYPKADASRQQQTAGNSSLNSSSSVQGQNQKWSQDQKKDQQKTDRLGQDQKSSTQTQQKDSDFSKTTREFEPDSNEPEVVNPTMQNQNNKQKSQYDRQDRV